MKSTDPGVHTSFQALSVSPKPKGMCTGKGTEGVQSKQPELQIQKDKD